MIAVIADWCGIFGFALTVILLLRSEALRKEVESQKREYQEQKADIKIRMIALRDNLWSGQPLSLKLVSEIRTLLFLFDQKFGRLRTREDKRRLKSTHKILTESLGSINIEQLCRELDYFIARFEREEIK